MMGVIKRVKHYRHQVDQPLLLYVENRAPIWSLALVRFVDG